jgi:rhodanese-related sulfurtransferase
MAMSAAASRVLQRVLASQTCNHMMIGKQIFSSMRSFRSCLAHQILQNNTNALPKSSFLTLKRTFVCTASNSNSSSPSSTSSSSNSQAQSSTQDPNRQVRVSHILLPAGSESTIEDFKSQILAKTATLEDLAQQHSTCPSAKKGGDIGWISKGRTVPEFEVAAYATEKGSLSTCISPFGVHLIQVTDERIARDVGHCTVQELSELLSSVAVDQDLLEDIQFVDVREPHEVEIVSLPYFKVLPLGSFQEWAKKLNSLLDPSKKTYVLCHHGMRSMQASNYFLENGFSQVFNISGGIDAYSRGVDNNLPRY